MVNVHCSFIALLFYEKRRSEATVEDKTDSSWLVSHQNAKHTIIKREIEGEGYESGVCICEYKISI